MADNKQIPLDQSAGESSVPMTGGAEFSLQPCTRAKSKFTFTGDRTAPKRKKAPMSTAGLEGCAPKRRGGEEEEPWRAVDSQLTLLEGEEGDDSDYEEFMVGLRARFAAKVQKMLADNPSVVVVDYSKPPCTSRPDCQNIATKEDEELGGALVTPPVLSG